MSYLSVIPLADAKLYLRVDDMASDDEIIRMIKSSLSYIEKHTNVMVYARDKNYILTNNCIRVHDGPINSVVKGLDKAGADVTLTLDENYSVELRTLHSFYSGIDSTAVQLVLNVGYSDPTEVDQELIEAALEMIDYWYYKNDGKANITLIPESVKAIIETNRRFII